MVVMYGQSCDLGVKQIMAENAREFHLVDDVRGIGRVSTVKLPVFPGLRNIHKELGCEYETCIFWKNRDSDVMQRYETEEQATRAHRYYVRAVKRKELNRNTVTTFSPFICSDES